MKTDFTKRSNIRIRTPWLDRILEPFEEHIAFWNRCDHCSFHKFSCQKTHGRGYLPAKYFFLGAAPNRSAVANGMPFVGNAGALLDAWIEETLGSAAPCFITNLLACRPTSGPGQPNVEPHALEVAACGGRIDALLEMAQPEFLILLGHDTAKLFKQVFYLTDVRKAHPALKIVSMPAPDPKNDALSADDLARALEGKQIDES